MTAENGAPSALFKAITQFSDPYERQARLYPALLALVPVVVLTMSLYRDKLGLLSSLMSALILCGALFLLSDFARRRGKAKEAALWKKWGGLPSTQVLRHSDLTFDPVSTQRYHASLSKKMEVPFPSAADEVADPQAADAVYASAGNMLRDATRDTKKFALLFKDNISYGFRRNGYGLRAIGIALCVGAIIWVGMRHGISIWATRAQEAKDVESLLTGDEFTVIAAAIVMLLMWSFYFTEQAVRDAAFTYARTLILTCESLGTPPKAKRSPKKKDPPAASGGAL